MLKYLKVVHCEPSHKSISGFSDTAVLVTLNALSTVPPVVGIAVEVILVMVMLVTFLVVIVIMLVIFLMIVIVILF